MNGNGSKHTNLTNNPAYDGKPAWSPDGTRILFDSSRGDGLGFRVMNSDGSGVKFLSGYCYCSGGGNRAAWSPDGQQIASIGLSGDGRYVGRTKADGTGWTALARGTGNPSWSPDGQRIVFELDKDLFVVNVDGSNLKRLTDGNNPAWSPEGQRIAFGGSDGNIYLINPDSTDAIRLTSTDQDTEPAWSPDGKQITFSSERDGNWEIYVMNANGSEQTNLTNNPAQDTAPAWSPE